MRRMLARRGVAAPDGPRYVVAAPLAPSVGWPPPGPNAEPSDETLSMVTGGKSSGTVGSAASAGSAT